MVKPRDSIPATFGIFRPAEGFQLADGQAEAGRILEQRGDVRERHARARVVGDVRTSLQCIHQVIATFLLKQAGLKRTQAHTGALTLIQRFRSAEPTLRAVLGV